MILAWAESGEAVKHLAQPTFADWRQEQEKYQSIENYLTEQIATKPQEKVFAEEFTLLAQTSLAQTSGSHTS